MKYFKTPEGYAKTIHHPGFWARNHKSTTCDEHGKLREFYHNEYFTGKWKEIKLAKIPPLYAEILGVVEEWGVAHAKKQRRQEIITTLGVILIFLVSQFLLLVLVDSVATYVRGTN